MTSLSKYTVDSSPAYSLEPNKYSVFDWKNNPIPNMQTTKKASIYLNLIKYLFNPPI